MNTEDYHKIIFEGYADNAPFYKNHLERESLKAYKTNNISNSEFFARCLKIIDEVIYSSKEDYDKLINELNQRIEENYSKDSVKYALERLDEVKDKIYYCYDKTNLFIGPTGKLYLNDLLKIKKEIFLLSKSSISSTTKHRDYENNESEAKDIKKNPEIFYDYGLIFFERLFTNFEIKSTSRSDLKFIYTQLKNDNYIHKTISETYFREWVNEKYDLDIGAISHYTKKKHRITIYNQVKNNLKK